MATVAIAIGVSLVGAFITNALTPKPQVENNLDDLSVLKSEFGVPIPYIRGRQKVTGNVIWAPNIRFETESQGGKGIGGGKNSGTVTTYFADFAVMLCEGEISQIGKIWLNNRVVYNGIATDPETIQASTEFLNNHLTIYTGTLTQNPDPTIEAIEGVGNVPGFRDRCYIVFRDLPLEPYGNIVPKVDVEVLQKADPNLVTLREVIEGLIAKPGIQASQYDVTDSYLDTEMPGFLFNQNGTTRTALEDLQKVFQFIIVDDGVQLIFRGVNAATTIDVDKYSNAAVLSDTEVKPRAIEVQEQEEDLPSEVQIEYDNSENNYNRGVQTQYKSIATHVNQLNFKSRVAMQDSQAQEAATKLIEYYWTQTRQFDGIRLNSDYFDLNAGDVINLEIRGQVTEIQIEKIVKSPDLVVEISGFSYDDLIPTISNPSTLNGEYNVDQNENIPALGNPTAVVVDTNLVNDIHGDIGLYATGVPSALSTWTSGTLYGAQSGGTFAPISGLGNTAAQGGLSTACGDGEPFVVDTVNTFQVVLNYGTLESVPDDAFYNLTNVLYIEGELIAFQNATLVAADTYDIDTLIRGVRGTEASIASHAATADVYLLRGNAPDFDNSEPTTNPIGLDIDLKAVPFGATETQVTNITSLTPFNNFRSYPYAPSDFELILDSGTNDLILEFKRRTRRGGTWSGASGLVPLAEDFLLFDIEIYNGMTLVRTISNHPSESFTYTSAQQIADFGSNQTSLSVIIYQISVLTGRGYPLTTGLVNYTSII